MQNTVTLMQKSLHCWCQKHCSLDAKNTALAVTEITALLVTVYRRRSSVGRRENRRRKRQVGNRRGFWRRWYCSRSARRRWNRQMCFGFLGTVKGRCRRGCAVPERGWRRLGREFVKSDYYSAFVFLISKHSWYNPTKSSINAIEKIINSTGLLTNNKHKIRKQSHNKDNKLLIHSNIEANI